MKQAKANLNLEMTTCLTRFLQPVIFWIQNSCFNNLTPTWGVTTEARPALMVFIFAFSGIYYPQRIFFVSWMKQKKAEISSHCQRKTEHFARRFCTSRFWEHFRTKFPSWGGHQFVWGWEGNGVVGTYNPPVSRNSRHFMILGQEIMTVLLGRPSTRTPVQGSNSSGLDKKKIGDWLSEWEPTLRLYSVLPGLGLDEDWGWVGRRERMGTRYLFYIYVSLGQLTSSQIIFRSYKKLHLTSI